MMYLFNHSTEKNILLNTVTVFKKSVNHIKSLKTCYTVIILNRMAEKSGIQTLIYLMVYYFD